MVDNRLHAPSRHDPLYLKVCQPKPPEPSPAASSAPSIVLLNPNDEQGKPIRLLVDASATNEDKVQAKAAQIQGAAAAAMLIFALLQWYFAWRTWDMQRLNTQLTHRRMQLETLLRGSSLPLTGQAPLLGDEDTNEKMIAQAVLQICGDTRDETKKARVEKLVQEWFALEAEMGGRKKR